MNRFVTPQMPLSLKIAIAWFIESFQVFLQSGQQIRNIVDLEKTDVA